MDTAFELTRWLSAAAFLFFGLACLTSAQLVTEFERYGLAEWRVLVGCLEVAGGAGLALGRTWPALLVPAALGLSLLMLAGVLTRIRIDDTLTQMLPALLLLAMNAFLVVHGLGRGSSSV